MEPNSPFFTRAAQWAGRYADTVITRDNLHLAPAFISKAAAKRLSQGIQAIGAYLRRLLLLLALTLEPTLRLACVRHPASGRGRHTIRTPINPLGLTPCYTQCMETRSSLFPHAAQWASRYADKVIAKNNLHLSPELISKAVAGRLKQAIRAMEAYLKRMLVLLALSLEPDLKADTRARPLHPSRRPQTTPNFRFRTFPKAGIDFALSTQFDALKHRPRPLNTGRTQVPARPLLERLTQLRALIEAPQARARKLAWHMARRRPGLMLAPGHHTAVKNRYGTEFSTTYTLMGHATLRLSRARPPPIGPVPRPPPRIRVL